MNTGDISRNLILLYPLGDNNIPYLIEYHTGELAPYSGSFKLLRHDLRFLKRLRKVSCSLKSNERKVPLSRGDPFPACRRCNTNVIWNG